MLVLRRGKTMEEKLIYSTNIYDYKASDCTLIDANGYEYQVDPSNDDEASEFNEIQFEDLKETIGAYDDLSENAPTYYLLVAQCTSHYPNFRPSFEGLALEASLDDAIFKRAKNCDDLKVSQGETLKVTCCNHDWHNDVMIKALTKEGEEYLKKNDIAFDNLDEASREMLQELKSNPALTKNVDLLA
jgi:hypothetical protein